MSELCDAVSCLDVARVRALLGAGHNPNALRQDFGKPLATAEDELQPDRPLKMVAFRSSDCMLKAEDHQKLNEIATLLLQHGANPAPAKQHAALRYGDMTPEQAEETDWAGLKAILNAAPLQEVTGW